MHPQLKHRVLQNIHHFLRKNLIHTIKPLNTLTEIVLERNYRHRKKKKGEDTHRCARRLWYERPKGSDYDKEGYT